jgi:glycerol-3-phosphate O-acyltransferase
MRKIELLLFVSNVLANPNNEVLVVYNENNIITHIFIASNTGDKLLRLEGPFKNLDEVLNFIRNIKATPNFDIYLQFTFVESPDSIKIYNSICKIKYFS